MPHAQQFGNLSLRYADIGGADCRDKNLAEIGIPREATRDRGVRRDDDVVLILPHGILPFLRKNADDLEGNVTNADILSDRALFRK